MSPGRPNLSLRLAALGALALLAALVLLGVQRPAGSAGDPLAAELERWTTFVKADTASDDNSGQIRQAVGPALAQASASFARGRRLHSLLRLGAARILLGALLYTREHPEAARSAAALEAEWKRAGPGLPGVPPAAMAQSLASVRPAAVRAMGEAALSAVKISYDASLVYGQATIADAGLHYLGEAVAQQQFVALCRSLSEPAAAPEPAFRSLAPELDALQGEMLAVYRPPVSIDRHAEFIGASAALKEARELDTAGLSRGALLRYLQATLRLQPLRATPPSFDAASTPAKLAEYEARLREGGLDHSLGRLFLEVAQADLDGTSATATHANAAAVAEVVLPRYFAALAPARLRPAAEPARVTVTLVRWPYT